MNIHEERWKDFFAAQAAEHRDAMRYRWIRERGAWDTEAALNGLSPEEYDAALDAAMLKDPDQ